METTLIWAVIVVALGVVVVRTSVIIVLQGYEYTLERFGRYRSTLRPGFHLIVPFVNRVGHRVNMMERVLDVPSQEVISKDNAVLTVERNKPGAHQGKGWERFTDRIVTLLNDSATPRVFMLWGAQAQKKGRGIDASRHCVLRAPHPSPLSAHRGFLGCRHFSAANRFLEANGQYDQVPGCLLVGVIRVHQAKQG